jgi:hypothetical protein
VSRPPNPRLQRTGLRLPLSRKPLGARGTAALSPKSIIGICSFILVAYLRCAAAQHQDSRTPTPVPTSVPDGMCTPADIEGKVLFQLSPGMVIGAAGRSFSLQIEPNGDAQLGTTGMALSDGIYVGRIATSDLASLRVALTPILGPFKSLCDGGHGSRFSFVALTSGTCYRSACVGTIDSSDLASGYKAVLATIQGTQWKPRA